MRLLPYLLSVASVQRWRRDYEVGVTNLGHGGGGIGKGRKISC